MRAGPRADGGRDEHGGMGQARARARVRARARARRRSTLGSDTCSQAAVGELSPWMSVSESSKSRTLAGHDGGFDNPSGASLAEPRELFLRGVLDAATAEALPATRATASTGRMGGMLWLKAMQGTADYCNHRAVSRRGLLIGRHARGGWAAAGSEANAGEWISIGPENYYFLFTCMK